MNSTKMLEMLNEGRIEDLKNALSDKIYAESLKTKSGAKKRYAAMKRYFTYHKSARAILQKPYPVEFEGKTYTSFCNAWSLALTSEDIGEIELHDESEGKYPDVTRLIRFDGIKKKIDFKKVISEAKSKGYRLNKTEVGSGFKYLMHYDGSYYKIGLIDATYGIIDDDRIPITYHPDGYNMPLSVKNSIGLCMIMPVRFETNPEEDEKIVIEVE